MESHRKDALAFKLAAPLANALEMGIEAAPRGGIWNEYFTPPQDWRRPSRGRFCTGLAGCSGAKLSAGNDHAETGSSEPLIPREDVQQLPLCLSAGKARKGGGRTFLPPRTQRPEP